MKNARMRSALAGLGVAMLALSAWGPLLAAEAGNASVQAAETSPPPSAVDQHDEWGSTVAAGAIYSPFSTAVEAAVAKAAPPATTSIPNAPGDGSVGLVTTTVGAFVAMGLVAALVRILVA
jgi:hypothetical protein